MPRRSAISSISRPSRYLSSSTRREPSGSSANRSSSASSSSREPVRVGLVGGIPALGERHVGRTALEVLLDRPVHDLVHDHAVRDAIALPAGELLEQALEDVLRHVVAGLAPNRDAAALNDDLVVGGDESGVVAVLEEQGIFGVPGIAHPVAPDPKPPPAGRHSAPRARHRRRARSRRAAVDSSRRSWPRPTTGVAARVARAIRRSRLATYSFGTGASRGRSIASRA